jgi:hypothetical protein
VLRVRVRPPEIPRRETTLPRPLRRSRAVVKCKALEKNHDQVDSYCLSFDVCNVCLRHDAYSG